MERKLFGFFSSSQVTVIIAVVTLAVAVPSAGWAATNVAVTDSVTGKTASVNAAGQLSVKEAYLELAANPANFVRLSSSCNLTTSFSYSPPAGKALILTAADFFYYSGTQGSDNYLYIYNTGITVTGIEGSDPDASRNAEFGTGYFVKNGETLSAACSSGGHYRFTLVGYLVPSVLAPTAASQSLQSHAVDDKKRR